MPDPRNLQPPRITVCRALPRQDGSASRRPRPGSRKISCGIKTGQAAFQEFSLAQLRTFPARLPVPADPARVPLPSVGGVLPPLSAVLTYLVPHPFRQCLLGQFTGGNFSSCIFKLLWSRQVFDAIE